MRTLFRLVICVSSIAVMAAAAPPVAISEEDGPVPPLKRAWRAESDDPEGSFTTWPVLYESTVFATSGSGALSVNSRGERVWWRDLGGAKQVFPAVDETGLYLAVSNQRLLKLDRVSGDTIWEAQLPESAESSPRLFGNRLYVVVDRSKSVLSLDTTSGATVWTRQLQLRPDSVPAVAEGVVIISTEEIGSPRAGVIALDAGTGKTKWQVEQREGVSSPALHGESVVFGGGDFYAHALDLDTGKQIWRSPVEGKFGPRNMPAVAHGDVFLADRIGNIYRLDGETGKRKWIFSDTEGTMDQSFPVVAGKTLYIGSGAGWLYGVDIDSGELVWKDRVRGIVLSGAADAERFYFGVKFGDEGLYAYEHDPSGKPLEPERTPSILRSLIGGLALFVLLFAGVAFFVRRSRTKSS